MSFFRRTSFVAIGIVIVLCAFAVTKPDTFRVERSIVIQAPQEKIFPLVNDLSNFVRWSPYEGRDPAMKRSFSPATAGRGASYAWDGNGDVGQGRMEITQSLPPSLVTVQVDFSRPFEAHNTAEFSLAGQDNRT